MSKLGTITRRTFLIGSVAIAGGVAFGYWKYKQPYGNPLLNDLDDGEAALTPFVLIDQNGVTIIAPRAEMGQGVHTTLAALVAEELEVSLADVQVIHGPASKAYYNAAVLEEGIPFAQTNESSLAENVRHFTRIPAKFLGLQITGGSSSVPDGFDKMRLAGAAAREVLLQAAAQKLGTPISSLRAEDGHIVDGNGTRIPYSDLATLAATIEPPAEPRLKPQSAWKILGKSQPRVDMVAKSTGTAAFAIDTELPDMVYATVKMNPCLGSAMKSYDASKAESMPGVVSIFEINNGDAPGGVAVVATNTWYAFKAANAIEFDWESACYAPDTAGLYQAVEDSFVKSQRDSRFRDDGDVEQALAGADVVSAEYRVPYLAHATMEPMNATAWLRNGKLDVWAGNQLPTQVVKEGMTITGLNEGDIEVHTPFMGGGFGRRAEMDFIVQAIKIAKRMEGTPVKLTWSREEDTTHDFYRPMAIGRFKAVVDENGPRAFDLELAAASVIASQMGRIGIPAAGPDVTIAQAAWDQPYAIPNYRVTAYRSPAEFPVSSWRSVGASQNAFFHESMLDEIAHSGGLDPMEMRLKLMNHEPSRKVLEAVAEISNWGSAMPDGHGRGVAFNLSFGVPTAEVIEVAYENGAIRILNAFAAVDVGTALDPRNIEAQVMSGINFGLAAAMMSDITVANGRVEHTNFHNYNSIRMNQSPPVKVRVLENGSKIRGIGEPGLPPAAPALANAIFAATGKRIRELPMNKHVKFA